MDAIRKLITWQNASTVILVVLILSAGYWLRSVGRNWDDYTKLHPDERFLSDVAGRLGASALNVDPETQTYCTEKYPAPAPETLDEMSEQERRDRLARVGRGGYFDARCSDLNPNNIGFGLYVYGEFPLFTTRLTAETMRELEFDQCEDSDSTDCDYNRLTNSITTYTGVNTAGRMVSSVADTLTIFVVFLIALQLFGRPVALLAAAFYAFAAFPIQQSYFWTADAFTALWVALSIYGAVLVLDEDANRPAKFTPLLWIAGAFSIWALDVGNLETISAAPFILHLAAFGVACGWASISEELPQGLMGIAASVAILLAGMINGWVSPLGVIASLTVLSLITAAITLGLNRFAAHGGTIPWLMLAFGIWVFDGHAHYFSPSLIPLAMYLIIFSLFSLLGSTTYRTIDPRKKLESLLLFSVPLYIWGIASAIVGTVSWQGMLFALVAGSALSSATAFGYKNYALFGIAFGASLASRVNVLPLVGLLILAGIIRGFPLLDRNLYIVERYRIATKIMVGLMIAGAFTLILFRVLQPHAFTGISFAPIVPSGINDRWLDDVNQARYLVSGEADIPPNHQWADRVPWLFPWQNMVLYGMGIFGLIGWIGFGTALWRTVRGNPNWTRYVLLVAWIAVYFGWLGANWVSTMRYFLPIYSSIAILAAWALVELLQWAWRLEHRWQQFARVGAAAITVFTIGYTLLYGYGMANLHRQILTRVGASIWMEDNIAGNLGVWVERDDGTYDLQNVATSIVGTLPSTFELEQGVPRSIPLDLTGDVTFESLILHRVTDPMRTDEEEILTVRILRNDPADIEPLLIAEQALTTDFASGASDFGEEYIITFDEEVDLPFIPAEGVAVATYRLELELVEGERIVFSRNVSDNILPVSLFDVTINLKNPDTNNPVQITYDFDEDLSSLPDPAYTFYMPSQLGQATFTSTANGVVNQIEIPHIADPLKDADDETLRLEIAGTDGTISYGQLTGNFHTTNDGVNTLGPSATITLDPPLKVQKDQRYTISITTDAPLMTLGHAVATEGPWDDPLPYKYCPPETDTISHDMPSGYTTPTCAGLDLFFSHYYGLELFLAAEDDETKRQTLIDVLDTTDYLTISSNRFYDSQSRIPYRWPMTMDYYDALWDGSLGFELVLEWTAYPNAFGIEWKNQVLPTDDLPSWMNEFEAEEAFHVYDHPAVFIFQKTDAYDPLVTREILSTPLRTYTEALGGLAPDAEPVNRNVVNAPQASTAPTGLLMPEAVAEAQRDQTWSEMFNPNAWVNQSQTAAVVLWWLLMMLVGWVTLPIMFAVFPGLNDAGFAAGKLVGWLVVAWVAWVGATLRLPTWSRDGITILLIGWVLVSAGFATAHWHALTDWLRKRWGQLLFLEILTGLLFAFFLYVRYRNPDLWHNSFGGEKPMDFAYFNAILRSEVFPAIDPWFAGGYINYYYWGFVLVAAPVKFLGIDSAVAYNLIIPTLFAMTAMGAFSIAYNLVAGFKSKLLPKANPWIAGIAALLLVSILGNLDTIRVFALEVSKVGGWNGTAAYDLTTERRIELMDDFRTENGREPSGNELQDINERAENPPFFTKIQHDLTVWADATEGFMNGIGDVMHGEPLQMHTHRWYWAPTRIIAELPDGRGHNAINEMPYFTFLYGDLHAHMISMPIMLLVLLWLTAEVRGAGITKRGRAAAIMAMFIGGLSVGILRAVNTWDLPAFAILGLVGLTYVAWLRQKQLHEDQDIQPAPMYETLQRYMDIQHVQRLWWMLAAIPVGFMLYGIVYLFQTVSYQDKLSLGEIPLSCRELNPDFAIPPNCDGLLEPSLSLGSMIIWGFGTLGLFIAGYVVVTVLFGMRFDRRTTLDWIGRLLAFGGITYAVALPFAEWYSGSAEIEAWESDRTPLWAYLDIHGLFLFLFASFLLWRTARWLKTYTVADLRGLGVPSLIIAALVPITLLATLVIGFSVPVMWVTLPLIVWSVALFMIPNTNRVERSIYVLMVLGLGLTTGVEIVRLNVDIGRQNTVFKFYVQAWLLFGISGAVMLSWLVASLPRWGLSLRTTWQSGLAILVTLAALYPLMATQARWEDRFNAADTGNTLDGQSYMPHAVYGDNAVWFNLRGDYNMINWIKDNIEGTPTIIEAQTTEYKWGARIAINTGLPTVLGWNFHQRQQRNAINLDQVVWNRASNISAFYTTTDLDTTWRLIDFYEIEYIVVGVLERVLYNDLVQDPITINLLDKNQSNGLQKFERMVELGLLEVVYEAESCVINQPLSAEECNPQNIVTDRIYRVLPDAEFNRSELGG